MSETVEQQAPEPPLDKAGIPPKVNARLEAAFWPAFVVGSAIAILGLVLVPVEGGCIRVAVAWLVLVISCAAFLVASIMTVVAARGYRARSDQIRGALAHMFEGGRPDMVERSDGRLTLSRTPEAALFKVEARDTLLPRPYWGLKKWGLYLPLREYVDLIEAEVRSARFAAGRMAASAGGLFVAAMQVYARLTAG